MRCPGPYAAKGVKHRASIARLRDEGAQMTVELAITLPVLIVFAFVVANLMHFVELCGRFDRIAAQTVIACGVSPNRSTDTDASAQVKAEIEKALGNADSCSVEVSAQAVGRLGEEGAFSITPALTRYVCRLEYRPWPSAFVLAGTAYQAPTLLVHSTQLVVDRYRTGVVI